MSKKPAIPDIQSATANPLPFMRAVKERLEIIAGQRGAKIHKLQPDADPAAVIAKINEVIDRLQ